MSKKKNQIRADGESESYQSILGEDAAEFAEETPAAEETAKPASKEDAEKKVSKKKILTVVGVSAASVALVGCLTFAGIGIFNKNKVQVAASTANIKVDAKVAACYYRDYLQMYIDSYGAETLLSSYGMDVNASLKDQPYPYDQTVTWFDMLMDQSMSSLEQQLVLCEAANAAGHTPSEKELQQIETLLSEADLSMYGNGVTEADLRKALELQCLSSSYYTAQLESLTPTQEEIDAYFAEHEKNFLTCSLAGFSVSYAAAEEGGMTQAEAKAIAEKLQNAKSPAAFEQIVSDYLVEYEEYTDEQLASLLPSIFTDGFTYTEGNEIAEWAFGGAKKNDTHLIEGEGAYYIYMMTEEPAKDETKTVNVRHILFMTAEDNMAAAEAALEEWENGEATEDSFAALADQYSEDTGSNTNGGLYENVYVGQMVETFNDWCFDESRKPGDTGIVETNYGVHVMYYSEDAAPMWQVNIEEEMIYEKYGTWYEEQMALYPVTVNDVVLGNIEG